MELEEGEKSESQFRDKSRQVWPQTHLILNEHRLFTITALAAPKTAAAATAQEKGAQGTSQVTFGKSHLVGVL